VRATFRQAEEILRLSEGYRLYAAPEDTFLARCAGRLKATPPISTAAKHSDNPSGASPGPGEPVWRAAGQRAGRAADVAICVFRYSATGSPIMTKLLLPRASGAHRFAFALTLLTGCALIQDDPGQVPLVNPQQAELAQVIHLANSGWPTARWWEGYQDPQLNMLVNRALQNSPTMQAARLRISQSQSTVELAQSAMGVQATAVAAQNRLRVTNKQFTWPYSFSLPVDKNGPWYTLNTVGVGATLNIDFWGADRARVAAAIGEKNARQAETAGIELDLASSVAQLYFAMQATFRKSNYSTNWRLSPGSRCRRMSIVPRAAWRIASMSPTPRPSCWRRSSSDYGAGDADAVSGNAAGADRRRCA
jgi:hypothetical protein